MAGYTRQSVAEIINGLDVTAPPLNSEFNRLAEAFDSSSGHSHDGSTGDAPPIPLATSVSGFLPSEHGGVGGKNNTTATANPIVTNDNTESYAPGSLWLNTNTGRVFVCVGNNTGAAVWREVAQITENDVFFPESNDTVDLGTTSKRFRNLFLSGGLTMDGNASIGGTLGVTGGSTFTGDVSADNVTATGTTTLANVDINGGAIDDTTIGNSTPAAGNFSTVDVDGGTIDGTTIGSVTPSTGAFTSVDIDGGNIDGTTIGGASATAGTFTNLTATSGLTAATADINGGSLDGATIGGSSPAGAAFTSLTATTSVDFSGATVSNLGTVTTADINGGTIDGSRLGGTTPITQITVDNIRLDANTLSSLNSNGNINITPNGTGEVVMPKVDIAGGEIDGTTIGGSSAAAGNFTTISSSGQATLDSADIDGGSIDGATIGNTSADSGKFTTLQSTGGITGDLTGDVTGNVTGNVTGDITGDVTGDLTGDVTSSGTSTFADVTISGSLNMDAATASTIVNLTDPTNAQDAATKAYVDSEIGALIDGAPDALDTLKELADALANDADAFTTLENKINTKVSKAGDTMTGVLDMGTNKVTSSATPTASSDLTNKTYVDAQRDTRVAKSGDSMSGNLEMSSNKVTGLSAPTNANDATRKAYVDDILGSATAASDSADAAAESANDAANSASAASTSESNALTSENNAASSESAALTSENNAATSEQNASNSASAALTSENNAADSASAALTSEDNAQQSANAAANSFDSFDDRYLGAKSSAPSADNDGDPLLVGALYFDTTENKIKIYDGDAWLDAFVPSTDFLQVANNLSDVGSASTSRTNLGLGTVATQNATSVSLTGGTIIGLSNIEAAQASFTGTGAIVLPDGTQAQRPSSPNTGAVRFNTDDGGFEGYDGSVWGPLGGGATGGGADQVFVENDQTVTADYTITAGRNASTTGPLEIADGVTVSVPDGSRLVVL